jgi:hypothetical protein
VFRPRVALLVLIAAALLFARVWRVWAPSDRVAAAPTVAGVPVDESPDNLSPLPPAGTDEPPAAVEAPPAPSLLGEWEDDFYGKRRLTFRPDGTAEMVLELDAVGRLIYGPQLKFFIEWQQVDDTLTLKMTGGEPRESTATLSKLFGESSEQRIESLTADELRLRSLDSRKLYIHRRPPPAEASPVATESR